MLGDRVQRLGAEARPTMNWRWLIFDFIPPAFYVDRVTRREIRREVKKDKSLLWGRDAFVRTLIMLPALLAVFAVTYWLTDQGIRTGRMRFSVLAYIFLSSASYVIGLIAYAPLRARQTFQAMRRRGFAVCTSCGYPLTHLPATTTVCPECGAARPSLDAEGASPYDDEEPPDALPPSGFFQWFGRPGSQKHGDLVRSARLVILDSDRRVLLFRYVEPHRPPFWSTAGGRLEPGEDFRAAAERELREETGFSVQVGRLLHTRESARYLEQYFLVQCSGGAPDGAGWTEDERSIIREHRWWSGNELRETSERFLPESLPALLIEWCG